MRATMHDAEHVACSSPGFLHNEPMKRPFLLLLAILMLGSAAAGGAAAPEYPTRQITLIAPWPAGGAIDTLCRALAPYLADRLGKPLVVENRPGAGSVIGTAAGAKSAPDGYTLVMAGSGSLAISATMYKKLPYDPVKDLEAIGLVARIPFVLVVNPSLPVHSITELVRLPRSIRASCPTRRAVPALRITCRPRCSRA
jgi:tripartite-type tricarboxylate transporter receptor subunit TctC